MYTAERLKTKYSDTQHPEYRLYQWQALVAANATKLGYWEWVAEQINQPEPVVLRQSEGLL